MEDAYEVKVDFNNEVQLAWEPGDLVKVQHYNF